MRMAKIALWIFIALLISGVMCGLSFLSDVNRLGGWDKVVFGVGTQYDVQDTKEMESSSIRRIEVSVSSPATTLTVSDSQKVNASLTGSVRTSNPKAVPYLEMNVSGDTLYIAEKRQATLTIGFYSSNIKLDISIPAEFAGELSFSGSSSDFNASAVKLSSLSIQTSSGNVTLGSIDLATGFEFGTSSGNITVNELKADSARFSSSSGDKKINSLEVNGDVTFETSSGKTALDSIRAGKVSFHSSSGDFTAGLISASELTSGTSSGKVNIGSLDGSANLSSSSGDISLIFQNPGLQISASSSSGKIKLSLPPDSQFTLNARTGSGAIISDFALDNVKTDKRSLRGSMGDGGTKIDLSTSSGDISINKN